MKIILASASPRRRELLIGIGYDIHCMAPDVMELDGSSGELPENIAIINARMKAKKVYENSRLPEWEIIIAADTVVSLNNELFGKPLNKADAAAMLKKLSGHTHRVTTGYCLINRAGMEFSAALSSEVTFRKLSFEEIAGYLLTRESIDKSGSYAVQGAGAALIQSINGSVSNIIGLPVEEILQHAKRMVKDAAGSSGAR
jgi:septum formation protein